jgi:hypothetical protein
MTGSAFRMETSMRWQMTAAAIGLTLAGCAAPAPQPLWPGPDWKAAGLPAAAPSDETATPASATDDTATRVPRTRTRRGSGTPPDLLFANPSAETRPAVVQPSAPPPVTAIDSGNAVLSPRDPKAPYSAQGYGYQRQGTTLQGPTGTTYNMVGPSIFAPNGSSCHTVGTSLFCN